MQILETTDTIASALDARLAQRGLRRSTSWTFNARQRTDGKGADFVASCDAEAIKRGPDAGGVTHCPPVEGGR